MRYYIQKSLTILYFILSYNCNNNLKQQKNKNINTSSLLTKFIMILNLTNSNSHIIKKGNTNYDNTEFDLCCVSDDTYSNFKQNIRYNNTNLICYCLNKEKHIFYKPTNQSFCNKSKKTINKKKELKKVNKQKHNYIQTKDIDKFSIFLFALPTLSCIFLSIVSYTIAFFCKNYKL